MKNKTVVTTTTKNTRESKPNQTNRNTQQVFLFVCFVVDIFKNCVVTYF